jgi:hypothetical protein
LPVKPNRVATRVGKNARPAAKFTVFPAARRFGWLSPSLVHLRKVAVITVSQLVAGLFNADQRQQHTAVSV